MIYNKNKILFIVFCLIFFCLGILTKYYFLTQNITDFSELRRSDVVNREFKYINPLLECEQTNFHLNKNLSDLKSKIQEKINKERGDKKINFAAVYFRDLNNGPWFGINEKSYFAPASILKIPVMLAYFYAAQKDSNILQQTMTIEEEYDYSVQGTIPDLMLEKNYTYTIEELIERMIIYSDNYAYALLLNNIDINNIIHVYDSIGIDYKAINDSLNFNVLSVKDYSAFFRVLFNSSYLDREYSEKALSILAKSQFFNGIKKELPINLDIANKFGETISTDLKEFQLHDCGIVYIPKKPYLLCIMTRGDKRENLTKTISSISKIIYEYVVAID
ncbi:MAG: class A beta-lactamase-related serine hydrolase [Patescibacteria group bacterium]|nr:class A beta-lactamase-related serine hydrolase [Patescibacteria group bacterium]